MAVTITYFVHGATKDNETKVSSGWTDVELSDLGRKEVLELKDIIKDKQFDVVFCSDLKRAVESAKLNFGDTIPVITDSRLRECNYGDLNGQPSLIVEPIQGQNTINRFPNGESYNDVKDRMADFLKFLKANYDGKHVAIVSHKAP